MTSAKPRVVLDSNVWISGLVFGGNPERIIEQFIDGNILIIISEELSSELRRKIYHKFPGFVPKVAILEASLRNDAIIVSLGASTVNICRDPDDNKIIETALIGKCDLIISGDNDLLSLKTYQNIQMLTPYDYLAVSPPDC